MKPEISVRRTGTHWELEIAASRRFLWDFYQHIEPKATAHGGMWFDAGEAPRLYLRFPASGTDHGQDPFNED